MANDLNILSYEILEVEVGAEYDASVLDTDVHGETWCVTNLFEFPDRVEAECAAFNEIVALCMVSSKLKPKSAFRDEQPKEVAR